MNYQEELRNLEREQKKLDEARRKVTMVWKKIGYSAVLIISLLIVTWISTLWWWGINEKNTMGIVLAVFEGMGLLIGGVLSTAAWFCYLDDIIESINSFFDNISETSRLSKTEKDRKAKIEFFKRLLDDPDFMKAWEDQMTDRNHA